MHRLPSVASSLSSKLGGPKAPKQDRRSLLSSAAASATAKASGVKTASRPGDPATRQVQLGQRRKIARVTSEASGRQDCGHVQRPGLGGRNSTGTGASASTVSSVRSRNVNGTGPGPQRIATLSRSATDTVIPALKKQQQQQQQQRNGEAEGMENELSLATIPASRHGRRGGSRVGRVRDSISSRGNALSQCERLSQRVVDFDAMTKGRANNVVAGGAADGGGVGGDDAANTRDGGNTAESTRRSQKSKKMEVVDAQLREAISAVKKPDRRAAVGKEFEEEVERRGSLKAKAKASMARGAGAGKSMSYKLFFLFFFIYIIIR